MSNASKVASQRSESQTGSGTSRLAGSVILCPGQGAQQVGMGRKWYEQSAAARAVFDEADRALAEHLGGAPLSDTCFNGPAERLNRTDVSQPAIYACAAASWRGLLEREGDGSPDIAATAGLSLGEYTALHIAGVFDFATGLHLVAIRGRLMQQAAESSRGSMVALIGADESQAEDVCAKARGDEVLVCANFNAPGQIVLSGSIGACERAVEAASQMGLRAAPLTVAGAFHSPLMQPAADRMGEELAKVTFAPPRVMVYSNVTAEPHDPSDMELLKRRLVEQIVNPVRWAQTCLAFAAQENHDPERSYHELAPGTVLRGLMKRVERKIKVTSHDEPEEKA